MSVFIKNKARTDLFWNSRELVFFSLFALFTCLKFYYLENIVTPSITRTLEMRAASAGTAVCLAVFFSLLYHRIRFAAALAASFLLSLLAVTDILYMRYFADMFAFGNLALISQAADISESVINLLCPADLLWFSDLPLLSGCFFAARGRADNPLFKRVTLLRAVCSLLLFALGGAVLTNHITAYNRRVPGVLYSMWDRAAVSNNVGAMTYHVVDARNTVRYFVGKGRVSDGQIREIGEWLSDIKSGGSEASLFGAASGKNLIIIQVESLQDFVVGLKVGGAEVTPNINKFLRESVYFAETYSQTGSGNSSDAEFLANTGFFPASSGAAFTRFASNKLYSLPKLLAQNGYSTLALHGDRPGFWNRNNMYPTLGFGRFVSRLDMEEDEIIGMGISDRSFFRQSLEILKAEPQPFYAFLVTLTSHHPFSYRPMLEQTEFDAGDLAGEFMGNYLTAMRYADEQLGAFIKGLRENGLLESSVVVIYGDHAAVPPSSRPQLEKLVGRGLSCGWAWRSMNKIPLIIRVPGSKAAPRVDKRPAGHADVAATSAALLGYSFGSGFGTNLFLAERSSPVIFSKGSYITGGAFVEPSVERAACVKNGDALDYAGYAELTAEVEKRLYYSNLILEHDLLPKLDKLKTAERAPRSGKERVERGRGGP